MGEPLAGLSILIECRSSEASRDRCLRRIWDQYYPRLAVFVGNCPGVARSDIEDLVQEIMEKIFRGIPSYDPAWSFSTWVYAIARHHCVDRARRARAAPAVRSLSDIPESRQPTHLGTPENEMLRRETGETVESFLESADPETRQMAFLRFHQGMGYRQISLVMGIPVGTVKFHMHRMREQLRSFMEEADGNMQSAKKSDRTLPARAL